MLKRKKHYLIYLTIFIFLITATIVISHFNWDIKLQEKYYDSDSNEGWYQKNYPAWYLAYHYGTFPAIILSVFALVILFSSWVVPKYKKLRKFCLLILLTFIIGPGIIINGVLKDHWGRPRPRQVKEFGGQWDFKEVWQHGIPGKGKSFPCGHCSMGFLFIVLYYSYKKKNKVIAYSGLGFSFAYGSFMGAARIAQGGHFLSDVVWAGGLTYLIASVLYYNILKIPDAVEKSYVTDNSKIDKRTKTKKIVLLSLLTFFFVALLVFVFLFSKPIYKEYSNQIESMKKYQLVKFNFKTSDGDIIFRPGLYQSPLQVKTKIQGFGYPKYQFKRELTHLYNHDTLCVNYLFNSSGYFFELDVNISILVDTSTQIIISGENFDGNVFVDKNLFGKKFLNSGINTPKGKIINFE
jgi:lipid A 4'-phosphatase